MTEVALPMNGSRSRRLRHFCITVFERTESNTLQGFHVKDVSVFQTKAEKKSLCFDQFHYDQFHPAKAISQISSYYNDVSPYYPDCHEGTVKMLLTYLVETLLVDLVKLSASPGRPILSFFTSKSTSNLRSLRISVWKIIISQFNYIMEKTILIRTCVSFYLEVSNCRKMCIVEL